MTITSTYSILPLVGSIFVIVLGFFVWLKKPKEWLHILFYFYSFTISIWLFGTFALFNAKYETEQIFWDRFIYIGVAFIPIFLYHFGLIYCDVKKQKVILVLGYLLAFVFLPLTQTNDFVSGVYRYPWGVHTIARTYHHLFLVYFFLYFILFFINLGQHYRKSTGVRKQQVKYLLIGYAILDVIGPFAFLPAYGIPVYPVIFLSAIPFVLFLAYAIIRHHALEMKTITVEIIVTLLNIVAITEIFFSNNTVELVLRSLAFLAVFIFSVFLVRSVKVEIKRREEVTELAHSLEQANIRLQELDKQKTEFLSIASHQLRTPLSILKGYIELIKDGGYGKVGGRVVKVLNDMDENNEHLVKLVDEFLNITRIEQGRTKFELANTDLCSIIKGVVKELRDRAKQQGLKLMYEECEPQRILCDGEKLRHVIFNFVDNAIKYSEKGVVEILLKAENGGVSLMVQDQGLGFEKNDEANFYQKFYRGDNVKGTNVNGTGLGLYVCRKFIEAHGGKVWAHSEGKGKGSEFGFWVPLKAKEQKVV